MQQTVVMTFKGELKGKFIKPPFKQEEDAKPKYRFQFLEMNSYKNQYGDNEKLSITEISVSQETYAKHKVGDNIEMQVKTWEINGNTGLMEAK